MRITFDIPETFAAELRAAGQDPAAPPFSAIRHASLNTMLHLELQPELEARLAQEAQASGLPLERYVEGLLNSAFDEDEELNEGLADIAARRTRSAREVFAELHGQYGIRG